MPIIYKSKLPNILIFPYFLHLLIDIFTHAGEWASKPLFPFGLKFPGFTNAWTWPVYWYPVCWLVIVIGIMFGQQILNSKQR